MGIKTDINFHGKVALPWVPSCGKPWHDRCTCLLFSLDLTGISLKRNIVSLSPPLGIIYSCAYTIIHRTLRVKTSLPNYNRYNHSCFPCPLPWHNFQFTLPWIHFQSVPTLFLPWFPGSNLQVIQLRAPRFIYFLELLASSPKLVSPDGTTQWCSTHSAWPTYLWILPSKEHHTWINPLFWAQLRAALHSSLLRAYES